MIRYLLFAYEIEVLATLFQLMLHDSFGSQGKVYLIILWIDLNNENVDIFTDIRLQFCTCSVQ
jgi:hypothetical protein